MPPIPMASHAVTEANPAREASGLCTASCAAYLNGNCRKHNSLEHGDVAKAVVQLGEDGRIFAYGKELQVETDIEKMIDVEQGAKRCESPLIDVNRCCANEDK